MVPRRSAARSLAGAGIGCLPGEVEPVAVELAEGGLLKHTLRTEVQGTCVEQRGYRIGGKSHAKSVTYRIAWNSGGTAGVQASSEYAATRLIPGGRTLQSGLRIARGPTGILRNSRGQFRTSRINNPAVAEAGDLAVQKTAEGAAGVVACN